MGDSMSDKGSRDQEPVGENIKQEQLDQYRISNVDKPMTTMQGKKDLKIRIN